jgi:[protein-PII] uridylyltransferase
MWDKVLHDALQAIEETLPLDEMINKKEKSLLRTSVDYTSPAKMVKLDNEDSDFFTIMEVISAGRMGLLYDLAKEIHSLGLDIRFAKINSEKERMTGVFYVRDAGGQKVYDEDAMTKVKERILAVIK